MWNYLKDRFSRLLTSNFQSSRGPKSLFSIEIAHAASIFALGRVIKALLCSVRAINTHQMLFTENIHHYCGAAADCACQ